jgi:hypothetical protein
MYTLFGISQKEQIAGTAFCCSSCNSCSKKSMLDSQKIYHCWHTPWAVPKNVFGGPFSTQAVHTTDTTFSLNVTTLAKLLHDFFCAIGQAFALDCSCHSVH